MASDRYFGDDMAVTIATDDATSINVGSLQGLEVVVEKEHVELDEADSTLRTDVRGRRFRVQVTASVAAFDVDLVQEWLSGDGVTADGTYTDTSEVRKFDITGTLRPANSASQDIEATVTDVVFPSLPVISSSLGAWVTHDLTGTGKNITFDRSA